MSILGVTEIQVRGVVGGFGLHVNAEPNAMFVDHCDGCPVRHGDSIAQQANKRRIFKDTGMEFIKFRSGSKNRMAWPTLASETQRCLRSQNNRRCQSAYSTRRRRSRVNV